MTHMNVAIIKYNAGNIRSVDNAIKRLGINAQITDNAEIIRSADKVIFPGVGEASTTMAHLRTTGLDKLICSLKQPVLGICLGMQLMCKHSEEGDADCLGIFDVDVKRFELPSNNVDNLKIPQMGWNNISNVKMPLFDASLEDKFVYFVHSYYVPLCEWTAAETTHTLTYSSALHKDNFYATQFHPEKSGPVGEAILKNFLAI